MKACSATTLSIMTLSIMTLSKITLSIMTLSKITLSIMALSIRTLKKTFSKGSMLRLSKIIIKTPKYLFLEIN